MDATDDSTPAPGVLVRFDAVQRTVHWINAVLFFALIVTAIPLYFGSLFGLVLPRHAVEQIHLYCGLALPVPILISLVGSWGRQMRRDLRRVSYWTRDELNWLRRRGTRLVRADKFNPGQKVNTIVVGASIVVMLGTGAILKWFQPFSLSIREGATFVHDSLSFLLVIVILGHVVMALTHPDELRSMFRGVISAHWAQRFAPRWFAEESASLERASDSLSSPGEGVGSRS